ncbi:universal stress protein [Leptobacterium flavescens]|uniref:Universal stress protein n=1 Tax=Leptobacterium flavescens TaxID=472055 RepID=A0A6P0UU44_9FLAO|nr:universal stress protein [Leptobacterium flavescens]NER15349.1 universal stress protein [Leptobacterium flavescens]
MRTKKLRAKYSLLVLTDLSEVSLRALKSAVGLAKLIDGSIEVFHVSPSVSLADHDNQISAMRSIKEAEIVARGTLQSLTDEIADEENLAISYDFAFGNIKKEVKDHIEKVNPDIIVLGKRKNKLLKFGGDNLTQFILKEFPDNVFVAGREKEFNAGTDISLGFLGYVPEANEKGIPLELNKNADEAVTLFSVRSSEGTQTEEEIPVTERSKGNFRKTVAFEFEQGADIYDRLSTYVAKSNIELLCMRNTKRKKDGQQPYDAIENNMEEVVQKLDIPMLILSEKSY